MAVKVIFMTFYFSNHKILGTRRRETCDEVCVTYSAPNNERDEKKSTGRWDETRVCLVCVWYWKKSSVHGRQIRRSTRKNADREFITPFIKIGTDARTGNPKLAAPRWRALFWVNSWQLDREMAMYRFVLKLKSFCSLRKVLGNLFCYSTEKSWI